MLIWLFATAQTHKNIPFYLVGHIFIYVLTEAVGARRCSTKKVFLKHLVKFIAKYLCQGLFFDKFAGLRPVILLKRSPTQVFSSEFCEIFKNTFFHTTPSVDASEQKTRNVLLTKSGKKNLVHCTKNEILH